MNPLDKTTTLAPLLHELADSTKRRGLFFLISDCFDEPAALLQALQHLRYQGHEVTLLHVLHPDEMAFPFEGHIRFDAAPKTNTRYLTTAPLAAIRLSSCVLQAYQEELRMGCEAQQVDYVLVDTSQPLAGLVSQWLSRRLRMRRM